jgi:hypothetical protein
MSWSAKGYLGHAADYEFEIQTPPDESQLGERPAKQVAAVKEAVPVLLSGLGECHVSVATNGHANEVEGQPGDSLYISIASVAEPEPTS